MTARLADRAAAGYRRLQVSTAPPVQAARRVVDAVRARDAAVGLARATYLTPRPLLFTREELPELLNRRGLVGTGVELGVREGAFSELLLDRWRGARLVSVDPWSAAGDEYVDVANVEQARHDELHAETRARLARFGARSEIWRTTSTAAAPRIPDGSLDLVYVDARHDEASVREDLEHWFGKLRPGGVMAGHDYVDGDLPEGVFGVRSAVDGFFGARGLRVHHTLGDPPWVSWLVLVPGPRLPRA